MILLTVCLSQLAVIVYGATTAVPLDCYTEVPGHNFPTCVDKYKVIPGHIFCLDWITRRPLPDLETDEIEKKHNSIRSGVSPPAANMMNMKYITGLGRTAQMWAETCNLRPSQPIQRFRPDCKGVICLNGGEVDYQTCSCNCVKEVNRYELPVCDLFCENGGDDPACGTKYKKTSCLSDFKTMYHCPWMCDLCPYAGKNYSEGSEPLPWQKNRQLCTTPTTTTTTTTSTARTTVIGSANSAGFGGTTTKPTTVKPTSTDTVTTKPTTVKPTSTDTVTTKPTTPKPATTGNAVTSQTSSAAMTQAPTSTGASGVSSTTAGPAGPRQDAGSGGNAAASLQIMSLWSLLVMINATLCAK